MNILKFCALSLALICGASLNAMQAPNNQQHNQTKSIPTDKLCGICLCKNDEIKQENQDNQWMVLRCGGSEQHNVACEDCLNRCISYNYPCPNCQSPLSNDHIVGPASQQATTQSRTQVPTARPTRSTNQSRPRVSTARPRWQTRITTPQPTPAPTQTTVTRQSVYQEDIPLPVILEMIAYAQAQERSAQRNRNTNYTTTTTTTTTQTVGNHRSTNRSIQRGTRQPGARSGFRIVGSRGKRAAQRRNRRR